MKTFLKTSIPKILLISMLGFITFGAKNALASTINTTNLLLHYSMALHLKDYQYIAKLYQQFTSDMKYFGNKNFNRIITMSLYVGNTQSAFELAKTVKDTSKFAKLVLAIESIKQQKFDVANALLNDQDPAILGIKYVLNSYTKSTQQLHTIKQKIPSFAKQLDTISVSNTTELNAVIAQLLVEGNAKNISLLQLASYLSPNDTNTKYKLLVAYAQNNNEYMVGQVAVNIPQNDRTDYLMKHIYQVLKSPDVKDTVLSKIRTKTPHWYMAVAHNFITQDKYAQAEKVLLQGNQNGALNNSWSYWYNLGLIYERQKNIPKARLAFNKAIALSDQDPEIINYLAYTEVMHNIDVKNNLQKLKRAYGKSPSPYIADSLGWAYYMNKDYKNALKYLEIAIQTMPMNGVINDHLGDTYYALRRHHESIVHWQRALLDTQNKDLNRLLVKQKIKGLQ